MAIRLNAGNALERRANRCHARFELTELRLMIHLQIPFHGGEQTAQLLLTHLHAAADSAERRHRWVGGLNQVLSSQQESARLRASQSLAAGENHQIEPQLRV